MALKLKSRKDESAPLELDEASSASRPRDPNEPDLLLNCLVFLSTYYKNPTPPRRIVADLPLKDGILTPDLFARAAKNAGLRTEVVKRPVNRFTKTMLPAILILKDAKQVETGAKSEDDIENFDVKILVKEENGTALLVSPTNLNKIEKVETRELNRLYSGYAILVKPEARKDTVNEKRPTGEKPKSWFWGALLEHRWTFTQVIIASVMINLFALASSIFIMTVYDRVVPNSGESTLWTLAIAMLIVIVFDFTLKSLRGYFVESAGRQADIKMASHIFAHVMDMEMKARQESTGSFANTIRESDSVREFFTSATITAIVDLPFVLLFIAVVGLLAGPMAIVLGVAVVLVITIGLLVQGPLHAAVTKTSEQSRQKHGLLFEALKGIETVKSVGAESRIRNQWEELVVETSKSGSFARVLTLEAMTLISAIQLLTTVSLVIVGVYLIWSHSSGFTQGALIATVLLTGRAMAPLMQVAQMLIRYQQMRNGLENLNQMMQTPVERPENVRFLHRPTVKGKFEFKGVTFSYPNHDTEVLKGTSFVIEPGEHVCILGRIGSGKSTVHRLMMKFYLPDSGSILVDDTDLRQIDPLDLRANIGSVPQETYLFSGTLRENIVVGSPHADDNQVLQAATLSGVHDFARLHPMGYDMPIGEGGHDLSGGQRQAISIARALLKNPNVLLMDEPTSAMDNVSEMALINRLTDYLKGRTLILTTHKASLLPLVDRILVIHDGKVSLDCSREKFIAAYASKLGM